MFESISTRKKSGLILAGILAATSISAVYHPQVVHGTNDCTTEWAAIQSVNSSDGVNYYTLKTLSGSINTLQSSISSVEQNIADVADYFELTMSGVVTYTSSHEALASSTISVLTANEATLSTMSGSMASLQSSYNATVLAISGSTIIQAVGDYSTCIDE